MFGRVVRYAPQDGGEHQAWRGHDWAMAVAGVAVDEGTARSGPERWQTISAWGAPKDGGQMGGGVQLAWRASGRKSQ